MKSLYEKMPDGSVRILDELEMSNTCEAVLKNIMREKGQKCKVKKIVNALREVNVSDLEKQEKLKHTHALEKSILGMGALNSSIYGI
jgi:hypothetical protein